MCVVQLSQQAKLRDDISVQCDLTANELLHELILDFLGQIGVVLVLEPVSATL